MASTTPPKLAQDCKEILLVQNYCHVAKILQFSEANNLNGNQSDWNNRLREFNSLFTLFHQWENKEDTSRLVFHQICRLVDRLSRINPIEEMRKTMVIIRRKIFELGYAPSFEPCVPSRFLCLDDLTPISMDSNPIWKNIFVESHGRITTLHRALHINPMLHEYHYNMHHFIMIDESGPLPRTWKHFLAILTASRHHSEYITRMESCLFLACGGDINWLQDPSSIPVKLKRIQNLISLLAHRPWEVTQENFHDMMTGVQPWTIAELCQSLLIIAHYLALTSMCWGLGLSCEDFEDLGSDDLCPENPDEFDESESLSPSVYDDVNSDADMSTTRHESDTAISSSTFQRNDDYSQSLNHKIETEKYLLSSQLLPCNSHRDTSNYGLKDLKQTILTPMNPSQLDGIVNQNSNGYIKPSNNRSESNASYTPSERRNLHTGKNKNQMELNENGTSEIIDDRTSREKIDFECVEQFKEMLTLLESLKLDSSEMENYAIRVKRKEVDQSALKDVMNQAPRLKTAYTDQFRSDDTEYENFQYKRFTKKLTRLRSYTLDDNCILILDRYYPNSSTLLCNEIEYLTSMNYQSFGGVPVETTKPLIHAVWNYSQRLFGIQCDEFNYHLVNRFMTLGQKVFVKKLLCFPERLIYNDFFYLKSILKLEDVIHYMYLACQARKMATLSLALHTLADSMC